MKCDLTNNARHVSGKVLNDFFGDKSTFYEMDEFRVCDRLMTKIKESSGVRVGRKKKTQTYSTPSRKSKILTPDPIDVSQLKLIQVSYNTNHEVVYSSSHRTGHRMKFQGDILQEEELYTKSYSELSMREWK